MEKKTLIKDKEFIQGYFIDLECCMCYDNITFSATTKRELKSIIKESEWRELNSDMYGLIGPWCGCDYKD